MARFAFWFNWDEGDASLGQSFFEGTPCLWFQKETTRKTEAILGSPNPEQETPKGTLEPNVGTLPFRLSTRRANATHTLSLRLRARGGIPPWPWCGVWFPLLKGHKADHLPASFFF